MARGGTGLLGQAARALLPFRRVLAVVSAIGTASIAQPVAAPDDATGSARSSAAASDLSILTYNVEGLPWPIAWGRGAPLRRIGDRLAAMRAAGRQPTVVVLQEAFTQDAREIGLRAGYPYQVQGPYLRDDAGESEAAGGRWYRGETQASVIDSGLVVLSDLPVLDVRRAAFPTGACAGYDCLAAKGVVVVTLDLPARGRVMIATTHLNSRAASGAPYARTHAAYRRQVEFLARFVAEAERSGAPMVLAGDFNRGNRPARIAALDAAFHGSREALGELLAVRDGALAGSADAALIHRRARDMQLLIGGTEQDLEPTGAEIPFGTERDGTTLSDHMGFTVHYRLTPRAKAT